MRSSCDLLLLMPMLMLLLLIIVAAASDLCSPDPCAVDEDNRIVGIGYNGLPRGCRHVLCRFMLLTCLNTCFPEMLFPPVLLTSSEARVAASTVAPAAVELDVTAVPPCFVVGLQ